MSYYQEKELETIAKQKIDVPWILFQRSQQELHRPLNFPYKLSQIG